MKVVQINIRSILCKEKAAAGRPNALSASTALTKIHTRINNIKLPASRSWEFSPQAGNSPGSLPSQKNKILAYQTIYQVTLLI